MVLTHIFNLRRRRSAPDNTLRLQDGCNTTRTFEEMAVELDNYCGNLPLGSYCDTPIRTAMFNWSAGVDSSKVNEPPTPIYDFSQFSFPPVVKDNWNDTQRTPQENFGTTRTTIIPGEPESLFTWNEIYSTQSQLPPLVIRHNDMVGNRQLTPGRDVFMYYDTRAMPLHNTIQSRGVYVSFDDPVINTYTFFVNHGVRVFVEIVDVPLGSGPYFRYIGDYFVHRTEATLSKEDWMKTSNQIKDLVIQRYVNSVVTNADDPNPGNKYSSANVRKWYDNGGILPYVFLRPTARVLTEPIKASGPMVVFRDNLISPQDSSYPSNILDAYDPSVYSQESAPHDGFNSTHHQVSGKSTSQEGASEYTSASGFGQFPAHNQGKVAHADDCCSSFGPEFDDSHDHKDGSHIPKERCLFVARLLIDAVGGNFNVYQAMRKNLAYSGNSTVDDHIWSIIDEHFRKEYGWTLECLECLARLECLECLNGNKDKDSGGTGYGKYPLVYDGTIPPGFI